MFAPLKSLAAALAAAVMCVSAWAAVDVNKADQAQLETVKGIGPAMSSRVLEARKTAPFKDWNDLIDRVQGIGPAKAGKLSAEGLTVNGAVFAPPGATAAAKLVTDKK
ncbi:MAG: ComEA family DNA-binding protein [Aquincola tertiaricarbonis]|uniref:ComEA family DNA-binding protein n=1 Tax=Aquincola TaxID=391952 RepID=UPI000614F044|nr:MULTISPECIES: helix-hairpin-helix domain-containing protein [Aquincola]MCR5863981.1 helix-hairpin-helix domain-containing protein [Aquincola sp. J276]